MLQRNDDSYLKDGRGFGVLKFTRREYGLRKNDFRYDMQRVKVQHGRRNRHGHLTGDIDVVRRTGLRQVLRILCKSRESWDGDEKHKNSGPQPDSLVAGAVSKLRGILHVEACIAHQGGAPFCQVYVRNLVRRKNRRRCVFNHP